MMAEYLITSPDGTKYRVTGPEGATDAEVLAQVEAYNAPASKPAPAKATEAESDPSNLAFISGNVNKGIAQLMGMPVDFVRNVANLGIAGYGVAKGALGGTPPDLIAPGPGSSQWFEGLGKKAGMITDAAEPDSVGGRYAAAALQALPSALVGRPNLAQLPRAATAAVTSGVGGQLGADIAPEGQEAAGAVIGAMLPGMRRTGATPAAGERATAARQAQRFAEAKDLDIPIPPRLMKPDAPQQQVQNAITKELKLPEGTELSPTTLQDFRTAHYAQGWVPVITEPALNGQITVAPNSSFPQKIQDIARQERKLRLEFPNSVKDVGLQQVLVDYIKPAYTIDGAMAQIQRLREGATRNLSSPSATDDTMRLGLVQRKIANALEDLVEENVQSINKPELTANFREARKAMAQAHNVEASLDPVTGKVNPNKLAALQSDSGQMTGQLKRIADVTAAFPTAVKPPMRDEDLFTRRVSPMSVLHPTATAAHWASRLLDPLTTSRPYQAVFVDPRAKLTPQQERLTRILIGSQQADNARQE